jgi:hypothetical protein
MPHDDPLHDDHASDDGDSPAGLESLRRRLLADGADWRVEFAASAAFLQQVEEFGRAATQGEVAAARPGALEPETAIHETSTQDAAPDSRARPSTPSVTKTPQSSVHSSVKGSRDMKTSWTTSRMSSRMRSLWAGIAAIIVVALLAGVFYALAASRGRSGPASVPTATAQVHGKWQTLASLPFSEVPQGPAIAPSDPNTIYEATLSPVKLRRTTDQGAHWTELHVPGDTSNLESFQVFVSPLDAKMVFVTLTTTLPPTGQESVCPTLLASQAPAAASTTLRGSGASPLAESLPQSGKIPCSLQYYSVDGGASWTQLILPLRAALVDPDRIFLGPTNILSAQGSRLYAAAGCGPQCGGPGDDIVTSVDGGAHWTQANHDIRAAGQYVCDYSAAPSGSDVFAITATESCGGESAPAIYLWRSADAGAHWTKVRQLPANGWRRMAVVPQPSGQPLLYIQLPQITPQNHMDAIADGPTHLMVSADGGKTWTAAPASGISGSTESPSGPLGVLSDGTVIQYFGDTTTAPLYGWRLGATTWQMIATPFKGDLRQLIVARQGASDALFAMTSGEKGITIQSYLP